MRTFAKRLGIATPVLLLSSLGCGPEPIPVVPTPTTTSTAATPPPVDKAKYDLSPVAEPEGLVGLARWKNPQATAEAIASCANVPTSLVEQGKTLGVEAALKEALRGSVDPKAFAGVIATDAPVDMAVALDPQSKKAKPVFAMSFGLTSLDAAKSAAQAVAPVVEQSPGVFRIGDRDSRRPFCVIAASAGSTPARLICGEHEKDINVLEGYLARTAPTLAPMNTDLHAEMRLIPLEQKFDRDLRGMLQMMPNLAASQVQLGEPRFDGAVQKAAVAVADELGALATDFDKVSFDFGVNPTKCIETSFSLQFKSSKSWFVGTVTERADRAGAPPAIFWRAPKDSDSAIFGRAQDPARYTEIFNVLRAMVEGGLTKLNIGSAADRKALADLLSIATTKDANTVTAKGRVETVKPAKPTPQSDADAVLNNAIGWYVIGIDQPSAAFAKQLKDLVGVLNRKGLIDPVKKELGAEGSKFLPTVKTVAAPAGLGKDAIDVEVKLAGIPGNLLKKGLSMGGSQQQDRKEKVTIAFHILLMVDGNNTWFGFGANRDAVVKHMLIAKTGAPDSETIASMPGLEPLKNGKNMSGGFMTLAPVIASVAENPALNEKPDVGEAIKRVTAGLPHKGQTPIFITSQVTAGASPRMDLGFSLSKPVIEDLSYLIQEGTRLAMTARTAAPPPPPVERKKK